MKRLPTALGGAHARSISASCRIRARSDRPSGESVSVATPPSLRSYTRVLLVKIIVSTLPRSAHFTIDRIPSKYDLRYPFTPPPADPTQFKTIS